MTKNVVGGVILANIGVLMSYITTLKNNDRKFSEQLNHLSQKIEDLENRLRDPHD